VKNKTLWSLLAAAAVVVVFAGVLAHHYIADRPSAPPTTISAAAPPAINGNVLPQPRTLTPAVLVDDDGNPFVNADFAGHWSLVYFGYTYCPDVCPLALVELASVKKSLAERMPDVAVEYYLVSVDPARDTPERLHAYVTYFDRGFHGLTGSLPDLTRFATETGSLFLIPEGQETTNYLISHSTNVTVLDPDGKLAAVITPPHEPATVAADFAKIVASRD